MSTAKVARGAIQRRYGFEFPEDLYAFQEFLRSEPWICRTLELRVSGALAVLSRKRGPAVDRFYDDPPELFTVISGATDGDHWGYWFDDPGRAAPIVVGYHANDAFALSVHGSTLFEATRRHLELLQRDLEEELTDGAPRGRAHEKQALSYARVRDCLSRASLPLRSRTEIGSRYLARYVFTRRSATKRRPVAPTRNGLGMVVDKRRYRPIAKKDLFASAKYSPKPGDVLRLSRAARSAAEEGFPGAALKLGHDLWIYRAHAAASYELLTLAYQGLGRTPLLSSLEDAMAYRTRCEEAR
jgi:hypothetical protein